MQLQKSEILGLLRHLYRRGGSTETAEVQHLSVSASIQNLFSSTWFSSSSVYSGLNKCGRPSKWNNKQRRLYNSGRRHSHTWKHAVSCSGQFSRLLSVLTPRRTQRQFMQIMYISSQVHFKYHKSQVHIRGLYSVPLSLDPKNWTRKIPLTGRKMSEQQKRNATNIFLF